MSRPADLPPQERTLHAIPAAFHREHNDELSQAVDRFRTRGGAVVCRARLDGALTLPICTAGSRSRRHDRQPPADRSGRHS
jgi:hypothetical protein